MNPWTKLLVFNLFSFINSQCPFQGSSRPTRREGKTLIQNYDHQNTRAQTINYNNVMEDLKKMMVESQEWWPADYDHYGPLMIRLAWHTAGSYRSSDGRGGADGGRQRFEPERSWDDNTNLDKARRLLWNIKYKYGSELSWGDLFIMAGNAAIESMNGTTLGFCAGRVDVEDGSESIQLGPSDIQKELFPCIKDGECEEPLGANTLGLIYVNPEGHLANGDPVESAADIRDVFGRMDMNDSETVALIGGGHSVGKCHGACPEGPGPSPVEDGLNPWPGNCGDGKLMNAYTSGIEITFTTRPTYWDNEYYKNLLNYNWTKTTGPGEKIQWHPDSDDPPTAPTADNNDRVQIGLLTSDIALTRDEEYMRIVQQFSEDRAAFDEMFASAWYKLTTRDMGPRERCINDDAPPAQAWQHPLTQRSGPTPGVDQLREMIDSALESDPSSYGQWTRLAWQCASSFRVTDYQGGCNGARVRLSPANTWEVNKNTDKSIEMLENIRQELGSSVSMSDLIVLAGTTALNKASDGKMNIPFCDVGRVDDDKGEAWRFLKPRVSGKFNESVNLLKDYIAVMGLTSRQFAALLGAGYSLGESSDCAGLFCSRRSFSTSPPAPSSSLSNAYFTDLLNNDFQEVTENGLKLYKAEDRDVWMYTVDIHFKIDPELSAITSEFAENEEKYLEELSSAWSLLMNADMFSGSDGNLCSEVGADQSSGSGSVMVSLVLVVFSVSWSSLR